MPTLFEISADLQALEARLAALCTPEGEILPCHEQEADRLMDEALQLATDREQKVGGWVWWIRHHETEIAKRQAEYDQIRSYLHDLGKLIERDEKRNEQRRAGLKRALELHGVRKVDCGHCEVSIVNNGGNRKVEIDCPTEELAPRFKQVETVVKVDRDALRAALESGEQFAGVRLAPRGTRLVIR